MSCKRREVSCEGREIVEMEEIRVARVARRVGRDEL